VDSPGERIFARIRKLSGPILLIIDPLVFDTREGLKMADFFSLKMIDLYLRIVAHSISLPSLEDW
jgi:hypothetical protein